MQKENLPKIIDGIVKPTSNVATVEIGAPVCRGVGINNMLNNNPDEYTCHPLDNGNIMMQLSQPFYIGSLRVLLGNNKCPSNGTSFYIQTSPDGTNWKTVVDKRNENLVPSWYHFEFDEHPIVYIKMVGTKGFMNVRIYLLFLQLQ